VIRCALEQRLEPGDRKILDFGCDVLAFPKVQGAVKVTVLSTIETLLGGKVGY
jgi:hypothetical protein